jgi:hypothetical protein
MKKIVKRSCCLISPQPPHGAKASIGPGSPHYRGFTITLRHNTWQDSAVQVMSLTQRSVPENTQHSQETDIHAPGGIWTCNPSKQAAADPRLGQCSHWDQGLPYKGTYDNWLLEVLHLWCYCHGLLFHIFRTCRLHVTVIPWWLHCVYLRTER